MERNHYQQSVKVAAISALEMHAISSGMISSKSDAGAYVCI